MSDFLDFDLSLRLGEFTLNATAKIPLTGITVLSGPSGSGKTTLLRTIAGLEPAAEGRIRFAGLDWSDLGTADRNVGYVFQDARLFPHLDVAANLEYGAVRRGISQERFNAIIEALDLPPLLRRMPTTLSGGEARRVALGRALASEPRILLMDEPLSGLDEVRKARLMPYIARAVAEFGVPALYVTHSAEELTFLADRTLIIRNGGLDGWTDSPQRLMGMATRADGDRLELAIGGISVRVSGQGRVGETWALLLGNDCLTTAQKPGLSSSALSLKARVVQVDENSRRCVVEVEGQKVTLPWRNGQTELPRADDILWLLLPRIMARQVQVAPEDYMGSD